MLLKYMIGSIIGKLFLKLIQLGFPLYIVKVLINWYSSQELCVRWEDTVSDIFHMKNGLRQGNLLPSFLFSVCIADLIDTVLQSKIIVILAVYL